MSEKLVWLHTILQFEKHQVSNYTLIELHNIINESLNYSP